MKILLLQRLVASSLAAVFMGVSGTTLITSHNTGVTPSAQPTVSTAAIGSGEWYTVQRGDTLSIIAKRYGISSTELARANDIDNPNLVRIGQRLWIPGSNGVILPADESLVADPDKVTTDDGNQYYIVQRGDTLSEIAGQFQVSTRALAEVNAITNLDIIGVGTRLLIPTLDQEQVASQAAPLRESIVQEPNVQEDAETYYVVQKGDTLGKIANHLDIKVADLMAANDLTNPDIIRVGQRLRLAVVPGNLEESEPTQPAADAESLIVAEQPVKSETTAPGITSDLAMFRMTTQPNMGQPETTEAGLAVSNEQSFRTLTFNTTLQGTPTGGSVPVDEPPAESQALRAVKVVTLGVESTFSVEAFAVGVQLNAQNANLADSIARVITAGVNWVSLGISWSSIEPIRKGEYSWDQLDAQVARLHEAGLNTLLTVSDAPNWARSQNADFSTDGPPDNAQDFADMLTAIAERYQGRVQAIEVWSGQNQAYRWGYEPLDAGRYVELLCAAYQAVKKVDPGMAIISGGLTPTGVTADGISVDDLVYLDMMYAAGCQACMDALGAHPFGYNNPPDVGLGYSDPTEPTFKLHRSFFFRDTMLAYRTLQESYGAEAQAIWPTQLGWASSFTTVPGFEYAVDVSESEQAEYLTAAYEQMQIWGWVGPAFWMNLDDNLANPDSAAALYSIWGHPAYEALVRLEK